MSSLKDRLEAISKGEIIETGSTVSVLPVFNDKEMTKCVAALLQLVESSQRSSASAVRLRPPSNAIHMIL
jgi:hypothetical protein